jgi:hypothetical protein
MQLISKCKARDDGADASARKMSDKKAKKPPHAARGEGSKKRRKVEAEEGMENEMPEKVAKMAQSTSSKMVEKLKGICKQATITIPPNVYVKNKTNIELETALEELLCNNGLSAHSGLYPAPPLLPYYQQGHVTLYAVSGWHA